MGELTTSLYVVLYDGLGNTKSAKIVVAKIPADATIQKADTITSGDVDWVDVTCGTAVNFGANAVHCDAETKALRVLMGDTAAADDDFVTVTINGV